MRLKRGELVGYDGFKHGKWTKIHACVNRDSMPLNIIIGPGNDSRRLLEIVGGLDWRPGQLYGKVRSAVERFFGWLKSFKGDNYKI